MYQVPFDVMTTQVETLLVPEKDKCITNLRIIICEGKVQWNKLAAILQVDGDNVDAVFAKARVLMSNIGDTVATSRVGEAKHAFHGFAAMYDHLDAAIVYELERLSAHNDYFNQMSVDDFIALKRKSLAEVQADAAAYLAKRTAWQRLCSWVIKWSRYGHHHQ